MGALLFATAVGTPALALNLSVHVNQVETGDTIVVKLRRKAVKIHLWGVAAPVKGQPYFAQSKKALSDMLLNKDVFADVKSTPDAGNILATVAWVKPATGKGTTIPQIVDVGLATVSAGSAWWYPTAAPAAKDLQGAQVQAKAGKKGLWAEPNPVAPWTFGKSKPKPKK